MSVSKWTVTTKYVVDGEGVTPAPGLGDSPVFPREATVVRTGSESDDGWVDVQGYVMKKNGTEGQTWRDVRFYADGQSGSAPYAEWPAWMRDIWDAVGWA